VYLGYFYAVRGALMQQERLDILANNLANTATPGFKKDRVQFEDFLISEVSKDFSQGPTARTGRELDVALQGPGFFTVMTPEGTAYTRDGVFHLDQEGNLVTGEGYMVIGYNGPINLGVETGTILIDLGGNIMRGDTEIDTLTLVDFENKTKLAPVGANLFRWEGPGEPEEVEPLETEVIQGSVEKANASPVKQMVNMINAHRAFEAYIKTIQAFHEVDSKANNQVGRLK
jgi:flagellar basal-body rod protein FlgG